MMILPRVSGGFPPQRETAFFRPFDGPFFSWARPKAVQNTAERPFLLRDKIYYRKHSAAETTFYPSAAYQMT
jgi:hypothetical protein